MARTIASCCLLLISILLTLSASTAAFAVPGQSKAAFQHWKEQEDWCQFADSESKSSGKPKLPKTAAKTVIPEGSSESSGNFNVGGYVLVKPPAAPAPPSSQQIETSIHIIPRTHNPAGAYGPLSGWSNYYARAPYPYRYIGPARIVKTTQVIQTGPSRSSGNYYNPSTGDPSAAGNYYAGSGNAPVAMPVLQQAPASKDYWGSGGNPFTSAPSN